MNSLENNNIEKGAEISACGKYRYRLWRVWDRTKPFVTFLMLNPSTADENIDDPTIRRCIGFAKSWGYGGIIVCNLFAFRSTDPKALLKVDDPIGEENKQHIKECVDMSEKVICAWGNGNILKILSKKFNYMFSTFGMKLHYLDLSKDNIPKHPLYLKKNLLPIPYIDRKAGEM